MAAELVSSELKTRIQAILENLPQSPKNDPTIQPLSGGLTNQNFRVDTENGALVFRLLEEKGRLLGINRQNEKDCSQIASELGIAPEVIFFDEEQKALVIRFVEGKTLTEEVARQPERLERIFSAMKTYSSGPAFPGEFSAFKTVRAYTKLAQEKNVQFPDEMQFCNEAFGQIEKSVHPHQQIAPCHNDLLAANFLDDGKKIWILDWEYAAQGDLFFDLGNFAVNLGLNDGECQKLLEIYFGEAHEKNMAQLQLMKLASDMRESLWGFLQSGISDMDFDYKGYGIKHLHRFMEAAKKPDFKLWIKELRT